MLNWEISLATPQSFLDLLLGLFKFKDKEKIRRHALTFIDLSAFCKLCNFPGNLYKIIEIRLFG